MSRKPELDGASESLHAAVERAVNEMEGADAINTDTVGDEAIKILDPGKVSLPSVAWGCTLTLRQIARERLAHDNLKERENVEKQQGELIPRLQSRYPTGRGYVKRHCMTASEVRANISSLRVEGNAKLRHATALEAWLKIEMEAGRIVDDEKGSGDKAA